MGFSLGYCLVFIMFWIRHLRNNEYDICWRGSMAEQPPCKRQVAGSTPVASSNSENQVAPSVWDARNSRIYALLAQLVEHVILNHGVQSSSS